MTTKETQQTGGMLTRWYNDSIGRPETADEARGYWLFVFGVFLGVIGITLLVADDLRGPAPEWPVVTAAVGFVFLIAGPLIRLRLRRMATWLVYAGAAISLLAVPWFVASYPGWRPQASMIIGLYSVGLLVMAVAGVFVPVLTTGAERDEELSRQREELDDQRDELAELDRALAEADADEADMSALVARLRDDEADLSALVTQLRDDEAGTAADRDDLAAQLRTLRTSQARFELYEDDAGEWRWRLRHRNGNIIADGSQGYTRKHDAQNGMQAVRRDALGATVHLIESEEEIPAAEETFEPAGEASSQAAFERYEDDAGEHRWRLRHANGNIIADGGEGYDTRGGADSAIDGIREYVGPAEFLRADPAAIEVYEDEAGEWRWRLVHRNGNITADSGGGYSQRSNATRALERIRDGIADMEIEVYEDDAGEHRWRLRGGNGGIMADSGEGYASRSGAEDAVERVRERLPDADLLDIGQAAFEVYEDSAETYRWRLRHRNGRIMADSGEGYSRRSGAWAGIESVKRNAPNADVEAVDT